MTQESALASPRVSSEVLLHGPDGGAELRELRTVTVNLPTGHLRVTAPASALELASKLIGYAGRNNPKRGFAFVGKALGKHWPSTPASMKAVQAELANQVVMTGACDRPFSIVGLAETATALALGVAACLVDTDRFPALDYTLVTTRSASKRRSQNKLAFLEPHSHSPFLYLELPEDGARRDHIRASRTLVLCDDEMSTGTTLFNVAEALSQYMPLLDSLVICTIADMHPAGIERRFRMLPRIKNLHCVSLVKADFAFMRSSEVRPCSDTSLSIPMSDANPNGLPSQHLHTVSVDSLFGDAERILMRSSKPVLVIGCDETIYPAFRLAAAMETAGITTFVQSTTRSPLMLGGDISAAMHVPDLRGLGVGYYLYNFCPHQYGAVVFVHDSPLEHKVVQFMSTLAERADCYEANLITGCFSRVIPHA